MLWARLASTAAQTPASGITQPASGDTVSGVVIVQGTAVHRDYLRYELAFLQESNPEAGWIVFAEGDQEVVNGTLAVWDTTIGRNIGAPVFPDGRYQLRLRVVKSDYNYDEYFVTNLTIAGDPPTPTPTTTATVAPVDATSIAPQVTSSFQQPTPLPSLTPFPTLTPQATPAGSAAAGPDGPESSKDGGSGGVLEALAAVETNRFGRAFWQGAMLTGAIFVAMALYLLLRAGGRRLWRLIWTRFIRDRVWLLLFTLLLAACRNEEAGSIVDGDNEATRVVSNMVAEDRLAADPALTQTPESIATAAEPEPTAVPAASPTATPVSLSLKELVVCVATEPESLYLYGDSSAAAVAAGNHVAHGLYENLYTTLSYNYQAQGLEKLPAIADGDAVINTIDANAGDTVVNAAGKIVHLGPGIQVRNAEGALVTYNGDGPLPLPQMVVDFTFRPLVWSDGTPITAGDSVFSYQVAADLATPGDKSKVQRTASYEATGELTVRWTGVPGYVDPTYFTNVWPPLPEHQLGRFSPAELLQADDANRTPLSYGPFMIESWSAGEQIQLVANPHYYRAGEGLPRLGRVIFRFIPEAAAQAEWLVSAGCDLATRDALAAHLPLLLAASTEPLPASQVLVAHVQPGPIFEHIAFGINPLADYAETRPDWFEDVRVRQAMTMCTDRQRMVDELMFGRSEVMHAYIPDGHPLYPENAAAYPYDPAAANALLDQAGYLDSDGDGVREDIQTTTPFSVTLGTDSQSAMRLQLTAIFQENMRDCGIVVELYDLPAAIWYADGPSSPLFGRRFDLAQFAWLTSIQPPCNLYLSENITGPEEQGFGGWGNVNTTGWANEAFDAACKAALLALPGSAEYEQNHKEAARIFTEQAPIIPLFAQFKVAATRPEVLNFELDPTQPSELWNLYELDIEE